MKTEIIIGQIGGFLCGCVILIIWAEIEPVGPSVAESVLMVFAGLVIGGLIGNCVDG